MTDIPREELVHGITIEMLDLIEKIDRVATVQIAISEMAFEELTSTPEIARENWAGIHNVMDENLQLLAMFRQMMTMSANVMADDDAMVQVEKLIDQQLAENNPS